MGISLETPLAELPGIGPGFLKRLGKLGLRSVRDILWHFPSRYEDFSETYRIADLEPGQQATIQARIESVKVRRSWRRRMTIVEATLSDSSGEIRAVWFNQPYVVNVLRPGKIANFAGKVSATDGELHLNHPTYELRGRWEVEETKHTGRLVPIYPETRGLTSKGIRFLVQPILKDLEDVPEWIPQETLDTHQLPGVDDALRDIHFPDAIAAAEKAKERFSFEDLFLLQLFNLKQKLKLSKGKAPPLKTDLEKLKKTLARLPFDLTTSQKKSLWEILQDMSKSRPMNRLLQGDVGSGKTVVAALAAFIAAENGYQAAFMAPTEVLARQHFETLKKLFVRIGGEREPALSVGFLSGSGTEAFYGDNLGYKLKKTELQEKVRRGDIAIIAGTHAVIEKSVSFKNIGLVIIDEQHRFGVRQRQALARGSMRNETQKTGSEKLLYPDLTYKIRACLFTVKKKLGLGYKELIYQNALAEELKRVDLAFEREKIIEISYDDKKIGIYKPDFVIENAIILELKTVSRIGVAEKRQIWHYLKGSAYKLAVIANYSPTALQIERTIYDVARETSASSSAYIPHFLSMSATPIPRTLMLTVFGDLDISTITELPAGRKNIVTKVVAPENRDKAYAFIRGQVRRGRQAFVICPRIDPPKEDAAQTPQNRYKAFLKLDVKSVKEEYEKLSKKTFPDLRLAMLHGQMKSKEKESVMKEFRDGRIDILVSTSVVEVGVDVPNATIMMIEGSERFGLAQLYQLRGRVGRGEHQSFCFLFTDLPALPRRQAGGGQRFTNAKTTNARLKAILEAKNGFELAERDLQIRGPGEFLGQAQTGFPDTAMQALKNVHLVKAARDEAARILSSDPNLAAHPRIKERLSAFEREVHFE